MVTHSTAGTAAADSATADTGPAHGPAQRHPSPLVRLIGQARGVRGRLVGAAILGGLASGCAVALMATSAWLIARAAQKPPVLYLMVAVVAVRTFGIGRGVLRYLERLVSHDAAFRVLGPQHSERRVVRDQPLQVAQHTAADAEGADRDNRDHQVEHRWLLGCPGDQPGRGGHP